MGKDLSTEAERLEAAYKILAAFLDLPCNYGFGAMEMTVDEYMPEKAGPWREGNYGNAPGSACRQKFFELMAEGRKNAELSKAARQYSL
jgi:hypothetical protein